MEMVKTAAQEAATCARDTRDELYRLGVLPICERRGFVDLSGNLWVLEAKSLH